MPEISEETLRGLEYALNHAQFAYRWIKKVDPAKYKRCNYAVSDANATELLRRLKEARLCVSP